MVRRVIGNAIEFTNRRDDAAQLKEYSKGDVRPVGELCVAQPGYALDLREALCVIVFDQLLKMEPVFFPA